MLKRFLLIAMAAGVVLTMCFADQPASKIIIPVNKTSPTDGKQMYVSYCAPCHGVDGRGQGPAATAMRVPPTDLTALAKANHGKYPDVHVLAIVKFGAEVNAHGTAQMPVWGPILGRMNRVNPQERDLRMANLSRYLESIQVK